MNDLNETVDFIDKYKLEMLPNNVDGLKIYQNKDVTKQAIVIVDDKGLEVDGKIIRNN